jgi:twitching motility two-component system response regulator PilG
VRRLFDAEPEPHRTPPIETPAKVCEPCLVCQHPRETSVGPCEHCGCAGSIRDFVANSANSAVDERVVERALANLPARAGRDVPVGQLLGAAIGYLSLHRSAEALPFLLQAAEIQSQDYHLRVLCEDLSQRKLVLVVDDSATVRRLVSITLERQGFRVMTAVHGRDGLDKFAQATPDFIFLDITMPEMDGYEFCKTIRRKPEGKALPIVMLSGNDGIFDKVRGKVAGSTDYLNKPFHSEVLLTALHKHLKASSSSMRGRIFNLS